MIFYVSALSLAPVAECRRYLLLPRLRSGGTRQLSRPVAMFSDHQGAYDACFSAVFNGRSASWCCGGPEPVLDRKLPFARIPKDSWAKI